MTEIERLVNRHQRRAAGSRRFNSKRARERQNLIKNAHPFLKDYGNRCFYCEKPFTDEVLPTIDHYFPEAFCKWNDIPKEVWDHISNKRLSCEACNQLKACYIPKLDEYYKWLKELAQNVRASECTREHAIRLSTKRSFTIPFSRTSGMSPMVDKLTLALDNKYNLV
jgi:hypothetical protein